MKEKLEKQYLNVKKSTLVDIANKIREKTGSTDLIKVKDLDDAIANIGGSSAGETGHLVRYIDADGTVLHTEYVENGGKLTPPSNPSCDPNYIIFDEWNYDVENYIVEQPTDVGAIYKTVDDVTYMFCRFNANTGLSPSLRITGFTSIDWGDGTIDSSNSHTYAEDGEYIIKISGDFSFNTNASDYLMGSESLNNSLKKVYLKKGISNLTYYVFYKCNSLTHVTIPNSVTIIKDSPFKDCIGLNTIIVPNGVSTINNLVYGCYALKNASLPNGILYMEDSSVSSFSRGQIFYGCSSLESVVIPNSVTAIGAESFDSCSSLKSIAIPKSVTTINGSAFSGCKSLKSIVIPNHVTTIGDRILANCDTLKQVTLPNSIVSIPKNTFYMCRTLESVDIPNSVTEIGDYAFSTCYTLKNVTIPKDVTNIGSEAFNACKRLTDVFIECENIPSLSSTNAFAECNPALILWVNDSIIEDLKVATNWSTYANIMKPLSTYVNI